MLIISAPFGNYLTFQNTLSTIGTFTREYRGGIWYRLWRMLRTLRRTRVGWVNRLGLPNPGIDSVKDWMPGITSIYGKNQGEWEYLLAKAFELRTMFVELNLSCPNAGAPEISDVSCAISKLSDAERRSVIIKLPPIRWMSLAKTLDLDGIRRWHCCNTIWTPKGGLSGKTLKQYSLWAVEEIRDAYPDSWIIGGGGVDCVQDVRDYQRAGADCVSIGSMLLNPLNWKKVNGLADAAGGRNAERS